MKAAAGAHGASTALFVWVACGLTGPGAVWAVLIGVLVVFQFVSFYRAGKQQGYTDALRERLGVDGEDWSLYDGKRWRKL